MKVDRKTFEERRLALGLSVKDLSYFTGLTECHLEMITDLSEVSRFSYIEEAVERALQWAQHLEENRPGGWQPTLMDLMNRRNTLNKLDKIANAIQDRLTPLSPESKSKLDELIKDETDSPKVYFDVNDILLTQLEWSQVDYTKLKWFFLALPGPDDSDDIYWPSQSPPWSSKERIPEKRKFRLKHFLNACENLKESSPHIWNAIVNEMKQRGLL